MSKYSPINIDVNNKYKSCDMMNMFLTMVSLPQF